MRVALCTMKSKKTRISEAESRSNLSDSNTLRTLLQCTFANAVVADRKLNVHLCLGPRRLGGRGRVFVDFIKGSVTCSDVTAESTCHDDGETCADCGSAREKRETIIRVVVRAEDVRCDCKLEEDLVKLKNKFGDEREAEGEITHKQDEDGEVVDVQLNADTANQIETEYVHVENINLNSVDQKEYCETVASIDSVNKDIEASSDNLVKSPIDIDEDCYDSVRPKRSRRISAKSKIVKIPEDVKENAADAAECRDRRVSPRYATVEAQQNDGNKYKKSARIHGVAGNVIHDNEMDENEGEDDYAVTSKSANLTRVKRRTLKKTCEVCGSNRKCGCERNFQCDLCDKVFNHASNLRQHMSSHSDERPFICHQCGNTFKTRTNLATHRARHSKPYSCGECGKTFSLTTSLKYHVRQHTGERPFQCDTCGTTYPSSTALKAHVRRHEAKPLQFSCSMCDKVFKHKSHLDTHLRIHQGIRPFTCSYCSRAFASKSHMTNHIRQHTKEKPFKCEYCPKAFFARRQLEDHRAKHTGEKKYACQVCGNKFMAANTLKDHMLLHSAVKPFQCHVCKKEFAADRSLKKHVQIHNTENPLVCEFCGKECPAPRYLKSHMMKHTGYQKHECQLCGKSYRDPRYLKIHVKCHTGEGLLQCDECGHKFADPTYLRLHQRKYCKSTREHCQICGRGFGSKKDVSMHMGLHTGERPHGCDTCGRAYVTSEALSEHAKRHKSVEKTHQCSVCLKCFYTSGDLQKHRRRTKCSGISKQDANKNGNDQTKCLASNVTSSEETCETNMNMSHSMTQLIPVAHDSQLQISLDAVDQPLSDPLARVASGLLATLDSADVATNVQSTGTPSLHTAIDLAINTEAIGSTYTVYDLVPAGRQLQK